MSNCTSHPVDSRPNISIVISHWVEGIPGDTLTSLALGTQEQRGQACQRGRVSRQEQSPKMLNSNKKPKGSGISYERDLIKNEDKDNVKCYTPPQQPKSTIHSGSRAEREFSYVDQE
ncbi:hypothetical protein QQF64_010332 [Cirrhinus molitorella]|uniref:Prolactin receptor n=1 Tax=Cirrhinus molitorella TaxID=172907 RepID=A0ABR3M4I7_9TELE